MNRIPKQIIIEATNRCNLQCRFCPLVDSKYPMGDMSLALFKFIVDSVDFKTTIIPWMNGEPLLHPRYTEMIEYIIKKNIPCYLTTNGHIWNDDLFNLIIKENSCYQLIVSLDGLFDDAFNSIELARPGSNRKKVEETIMRFKDLKEKNGNKINLAVKLCQRGQDFEEVENYISFWLKNGIDYVVIGRALTGKVPVGMRAYPCQYFDNNFMVIRWDGNLVACAYHNGIVNDNAIPLGRVGFSTPSLLEIYNNDAYKTLRNQHRKGEYPSPCSTCGFAYTGTGMEGVVRFRDKKLGTGPVYTHFDYYNTFYSLKKSLKKDSYYGLTKESKNYHESHGLGDFEV